MKKSLIALAVLAASGAAMAQSSVTMYGVADLSLAKANGVSAQMSGNGVMNNGNSRLGVRGVEDLGGGLKASFNFEQGINAESGATDAATWQRAAWLALSGGFGRFQMGRTLTPSFWGVAAWELTGTANYSAVANQFGFAGGPTRNNSVFMYTTPNMGGFSGTLGYIAKPDNGGNAKVDANLIYANGPLAVALSYNKVNSQPKGLALGAAYDFGMFKLAGSLQDAPGASKGFTIGGTVPVGPVALTLDIARENGDNMKNTDVLLEAKYALSKRTFAYGVYYKDGDAGGGVYKTGAKNHFGLGVRHNF
ncbi:MAG: porin [Giesbergeria sp.]|nr:porin [Brachymonas sp.]MBP9784368.1 porin [Giesbergeria sp.]MBP9894492.1 porin [Giesbergeria sp.]